MVTIINSTFINSKLTILRNNKTPHNKFRRTMNEISYLIASEVLKYLSYSKIDVLTPLKKTSGTVIKQKIVIVPILRAGLGLVRGFAELLAEAEHGQIGLYRDEKTYKAVQYLCKIPKIDNKLFIILDPMLATGHSSGKAIEILKKLGVKINNIFFVSLLAAPEGIGYLEKKHKSLKVFTAKVDEKLNKQKFIVPGLGDAGDRYMGT